MEEEIVPAGYGLITEGSAKSLFKLDNEVFYNKVQVLNRDVSIQVIKLFLEEQAKEKTAKAEAKAKRLEAEAKGTTEEEAEQPRQAEGNGGARDDDEPPQMATPARTGAYVLDLLAASGLRSIRYIQEIPGIAKIIVNDLDAAAVALARQNVEFNKVDPVKVIPNQADGSVFMSLNKNEQFDVIDIDPYGSAAQFLNPAVQAVADGGLLCVTCTDAAVLNGVYPETCFAKYGSVPIKGKYMQEEGLRILLHAIDTHANIYGRYIEPLLSVSVDFYVRVFVRVHRCKKEVKNSCLRRGYIYQSTKCPSFFIQPMGRCQPNGNYSGAIGPVRSVCPQTGAEFKIGGPIWTAPIHKESFVRALVNRLKNKEHPHPIPTAERMLGLLTNIADELHDVPLFYTLPELASTVKTSVPKMKVFQSALINAGYRVSIQHKEPTAVKTDAPPEVVWDIVRAWVKRYHPQVIQDAKSSKGSRAGRADEAWKKILQVDPTISVTFATPVSLKDSVRGSKKYLENPEANWGPKTRAGKRKKDAEVEKDEDEGQKKMKEEET